MKITVAIAITFAILGCAPKGKPNEVEVVKNLSCPNWILGKWQHMTEKNRDEAISCSFKKNELRITHGLNFRTDAIILDLNKEYDVSHSQTDSTFYLSLHNDSCSIQHKFVRSTLPWSDKTVLLYSLIEDGQVKEIRTDMYSLILDKM
ncbi:MAG: hypothetical protein HRT58_06610 [Crocinitomicaceae bacterium]|nr:hypothetical protein [Flavobacteriales bacterium]NQZ35317.1 hypothetical protein [Crocinitomicaceae bacterium]